MGEAMTKNKEHNSSNYDNVSMVLKTRELLPFVGIYLNLILSHIQPISK